MSAQAALLMLSRCLSTLPPSVTLEAARTFDEHLLASFTSKLDLETLLEGGATRQCFVSLRRGGLRLRSAVYCAAPAFFARRSTTKPNSRSG